MKIYLLALLGLTVSITSAQNFIDSSVWTEGTGTQGSFRMYGVDAENVREIRTNPYGEDTVLWRAQSIGNASKADGGIYTYIFPIDHTKNYRFHVWIKKEGSRTLGNSYLGLHSYGTTSTRITRKLDDSPWNNNRPNPYFWYGDFPETGKWYLIVGYMYASDHQDTGIVQSAVYDGNTGAKVLNGLADFKFDPVATRMQLRTLLYNSTDLETYQHYYDPSVYEVNDQMPSIQEIINGNTTSGGGGDSPWTLNGPDTYFSGGKVGINTSIPDYELTVKGKIHAEEVKIDLAVPAPDYVFEEDYNLQSLDAVEEYIEKHGHLPNIPSALEMETNGVELGMMEMKLLEKVEELTLHLIALKKENAAIKAQLELLQKEKVKLKSGSTVSSSGVENTI